MLMVNNNQEVKISCDQCKRVFEEGGVVFMVKVQHTDGRQATESRCKMCVNFYLLYKQSPSQANHDGLDYLKKLVDAQNRLYRTTQLAKDKKMV